MLNTGTFTEHVLWPCSMLKICQKLVCALPWPSMYQVLLGCQQREVLTRHWQIDFHCIQGSFNTTINKGFKLTSCKLIPTEINSLCTILRIPFSPNIYLSYNNPFTFQNENWIIKNEYLIGRNAQKQENKIKGFYQNLINRRNTI